MLVFSVLFLISSLKMPWYIIVLVSFMLPSTHTNTQLDAKSLLKQIY